MVLQNTLDLSTFEIVRFRIWNQTSNPNDYGIGTKYFNTNSGHEGYNRENIYTATGWRRTAYLDDIEAITNGAGSLGTRVKALEDMLGLEDVTDVIDTWNDVKAFFKDVDEGLDLMTMLDGKLDKTGGTMTVKSLDGFEIKRTGGTLPFIKFSNNTGVLGYLGFSAEGNPSYYDALQQNSYKLIHTGNALDQLKGTFLPLTGGTINLSSFSLLYINNTEDTSRSFIGFQHKGARLGWLGFVGDAPYYMRSDGGGRALLHEDNVGEYAVKYDGTASVDKARHSIGLDNGSQGSSNLPVAGGGGGYISFGHDSYGSQLFGGFASNRLFLRSYQANEYGDWREIAFTDSTVAAAYKLKNPSTNGDVVTITEDGRVLINRPSAILDRQLSIGSGGVFVSATLAESPVLGSVGSNSLLVGASTYGMQHWALGNGQGNIQAGRFDGTATAYALNLNPLGGAVNVGDGGLNVAGDIIMNTKKNVVGTWFGGANTTDGSLFGDASRIIGTGYKGAVVYAYGTDAPIWFHTGMKLQMLINPSGNVTIGGSDYASETYAFYVHKALPSYFSNRVLIGTPDDDGSGARLHVAGDISLTTAILTDNQELLRRYSDSLYIGYGTAVRGSLPTSIWGNDIRFINKSGQVKAYLTNDGDLHVTENILIPTGKSLTLGSVTFRETAAGEVEVDGNLHTTGTLASGGKAEEGTGGTGGASGTIREFTIEPPTDNTSSFKLEHSFNTEKVIVQIFGLNGNSGKYEMILTDVEITDANNVTVTFGRKPTEYHKVYVMA